MNKLELIDLLNKIEGNPAVLAQDWSNSMSIKFDIKRSDTGVSFKVNDNLVAFMVREKITPYNWLLKIPGRDGYIDRDRYSNDLIERVQIPGKYKELEYLFSQEIP